MLISNFQKLQLIPVPLCLQAGKSITPFILRVPCMAFDPEPLYLMDFDQLL
jgi:hypothetical protein